LNVVIDKRKEFEMNLLNNITDVAFCEICDNYTPQVFVVEENESGCEYCWNAYGEIN
jgi:hypothetical protein